MSQNADAFTIVWCPDDEETGEPLFIARRHPTFGIIQFAVSLQEGTWPEGMKVEHEGEEWTITPGADEKGRATWIILSKNGAAKRPTANGLYLEEYAWVHISNRQAKPKGISFGRNATITEEEAIEIHDRYLYDPNCPTQRELGEEYGIGQAHVSSIAREKSWKHLWT